MNRLWICAIAVACLAPALAGPVAGADPVDRCDPPVQDVPDEDARTLASGLARDVCDAIYATSVVTVAPDGTAYVHVDLATAYYRLRDSLGGSPRILNPNAFLDQSVASVTLANDALGGAVPLHKVEVHVGGERIAAIDPRLIGDEVVAVVSGVNGDVDAVLVYLTEDDEENARPIVAATATNVLRSDVAPVLLDAATVVAASQGPQPEAGARIATFRPCETSPRSWGGVTFTNGWDTWTEQDHRWEEHALEQADGGSTGTFRSYDFAVAVPGRAGVAHSHASHTVYVQVNVPVSLRFGALFEDITGEIVNRCYSGYMADGCAAGGAFASWTLSAHDVTASREVAFGYIRKSEDYHVNYCYEVRDTPVCWENDDTQVFRGETASADVVVSMHPDHVYAFTATAMTASCCSWTSGSSYAYSRVGDRDGDMFRSTLRELSIDV